MKPLVTAQQQQRKELGDKYVDDVNKARVKDGKKRKKTAELEAAKWFNERFGKKAGK